MADERDEELYRRWGVLNGVAELGATVRRFCDAMEPETTSTWPTDLPSPERLLAMLREWQTAAMLAVGLQPRNADLVASMTAVGFGFGRAWDSAASCDVWGWYRYDDRTMAWIGVWNLEGGDVQDLTLSSRCVVRIGDRGPHTLTFPSVQAFLAGDPQGVDGHCETAAGGDPLIPGDDGIIRCSLGCGVVWRAAA